MLAAGGLLKGLGDLIYVTYLAWHVEHAQQQPLLSHVEATEGVRDAPLAHT